MKPRPPACETAVARGAQAQPPMGAFMMRGEAVHGRYVLSSFCHSIRDAMVVFFFFAFSIGWKIIW